MQISAVLFDKEIQCTSKSHAKANGAGGGLLNVTIENRSKDIPLRSTTLLPVTLANRFVPEKVALHNTSQPVNTHF